MSLNQVVSPRLKRGVSTSSTNDSNGYDVLGHLRDMGSFIATGQMPVRATAGATGNTLADKIALEEVKARLKSQNVNPLNDQLKQAQIAQANAEAESYKQPVPDGLLRVGKSVVNDPSFVDPMEQAKLDDRDAKIQARATANQDSQDVARANAQGQLSAIQEAKKGSRFFGPMGKMPTMLSPSSIPVHPKLPFSDNQNVNQYEERKLWENNMKQLLSEKVVSLMNEMKRVSKTGATGFGQLSNKELTLLQEASTALSRDLSPEDAMHYLNQMEEVEKKFLGQSGETPQATTPSVAPISNTQQIGRFKVTTHG